MKRIFGLAFDPATAKNLVAPVHHQRLTRGDGALRLLELHAETPPRKGNDESLRAGVAIAQARPHLEWALRLGFEHPVRLGRVQRASVLFALRPDDDPLPPGIEGQNVERPLGAQPQPAALSDRIARDTAVSAQDATGTVDDLTRGGPQPDATKHRSRLSAFSATGRA